MALDEPDNRENYGGDRFNRIGMVESQLLVVTHSWHVDGDSGNDIIRIVSARPAERRERKRYHEAWQTEDCIPAGR